VDPELLRELLIRRDEDQRVGNLVAMPKGRYTVRLPDEVARYGTSGRGKHAVACRAADHAGLAGLAGPHPGRLDELRAAVGLEPFANYEARLRGSHADHSPW
jgi:hypothetical protein